MSCWRGRELVWYTRVVHVWMLLGLEFFVISGFGEVGACRWFDSDGLPDGSPAGIHASGWRFASDHSRLPATGGRQRQDLRPIQRTLTTQLLSLIVS